MYRLNCLLTFVLLACFAHAATSDEPKWGVLSGQLVYDGEPRERARIKVDKPGFPETFDESLVVDPKTHGLANVFVYLRLPKNAKTPLQVHSDYAEQLKQPVVMIADERGFTPHACLVHTDQLFKIAHRGKAVVNVKMHSQKTQFGILIPPKGDGEYRYQLPELLPCQIGCNIHPWFSAYVLIRDNPYMAVSDSDGRFTIKNLSVGEHEFQFWQEKTGYVKLPAVQVRSTPLAGNRQKGRLVIDIQSGKNDLGEIKLDPKLFE